MYPAGLARWQTPPKGTLGSLGAPLSGIGVIRPRGLPVGGKAGCRLVRTEPPSRKLVYNCTRTQVEWDPGKARLNARKHGVALADAVAVLEDETALTMRDPFAEDEERWI